VTARGASFLLLLFGSVTLAACARHVDDGDSSRSVGSVIVPSRDTARLPATVQDTNVELQERLSRLEREARALAHSDGCDSLAQCRTAPVGWRSCGGPRTYLVYCAATTDTVALFRKLAELEAAEKEYNLTSGLMSSCIMREPPQVSLRGGSCRE
jgi:hypothetical protein